MQLNNFDLLFKDFDVSPILAEIKANGDAWQRRREKLRPWQNGYTHRDIEAIALRSTYVAPDAADNDESFRLGTHEVIANDLPDYDFYPATRDAVYRVMEQVHGGQIGRVFLVKLPAGKCIGGHYDEGYSAEFYNRFHLMVNGGRGNWLSCGEGDDEEHLEMLTGECWAFNHQKWHYFTNKSDSDRIYLNIDIR